MHTAKLPLLLAASFTAAAAVVFAEDVAIRTGTWEFRMGGVSMEGVPVAVKAQLEAEMTKPFTSCVTADDIKNVKFGKTSDDDDSECKVVSSKLTRTGGDVVRQCTGDTPSTQTLHIEAPAPQTVRVTVTKKMASASNTMTLNGKWLNATCKE
jgi:hypothetical protein